MKCNFADHLEEALRDQLVVGILQNGTRKRVLVNPQLTLPKTIDMEEQVKKHALYFETNTLKQFDSLEN